MVRRLVLVLLAASAVGLSACRASGFGAPAASPVAVAPTPTPAPTPTKVEANAPQVFVDASVLSTTSDHVQALGIDDVTLGTTSHRLLDAEEKRSLEARLSADASVKEVLAPKVIALSGQEARVFVGESHRRGTRFVVTPRIAPDGGDVEILELGIERHDVRHSEQYVRATDVRVPESGTLLLVGSSVHHPNERVVVLLTAKVVRPPL